MTSRGWILGMVFSAALCAQEYRASLIGTVTDPTGAAVPHAAVQAINNETGVVVSSVTNSEGVYSIPFLQPGNYRVEVEHPGFKTLERGPIELQVNDRTRIDLVLQVGQISDRVTVVAEAPLLEVSNADRGQVLESRKITDLPLDGHNPFTLMNLAVGVQYTGDLTFSRPFDNGAIADFSISGGRSGVNEYQIDGVSNNANTGRNNLAYVPPGEATQEFKVQTNTYDAQYGRTGGGIISVSIKPGTNKPHGAVYEYLRRTEFDANQFVNNATGQPRAGHVLDQYGFEIDGPVMLPRIYRGKDRTFFMFAYEKHRETLPQPVFSSVPTLEQRKGDFSQTLSSSGNLLTVYDPLTVHSNPDFDPKKPVTLANLQNLRNPFAGNLVPRDRMEPIALRVMQDIPLPTGPGDANTQLNNWLASKHTADSDFQNFIARVDHTLTGSWRMYVRWNYNYRDGGRKNFHGMWDSPAAPALQAGRRNDGAVFDIVGTLNPQTVVTARMGFNRFFALSKFTPQDISVLGLPSNFVSQLQMPDKYPIFTFQGYQQLSQSEWDLNPSETYTVQAGLTRMQGNHSMKSGGEFRLLHYAKFGRGNASGTFNFTRSWTSLTPQITDPDSGNSIASFLMGYMSGASATLNATPYLSWRYPVVYFQDDWQVSRRLTLNLGLRWDYESPPVERYNAQNRGFDSTAPSPYQVPGFDVRGGLLFAGVNGQPRGAFNPDRNNIQPRLGVAYKMLQSRPLVFRGGFGRAYLPTTEFGGNTGFTQTTNAEVSTVGFTAARLLSNPFPSGLMPQPGASLGLATQVGDAITFNDSRRTIPNVWQYSAGFQYELRPGILAEVSYVGSRTREIQVSKNINALPADQLALGTPYLNQGQPNPFYEVLSPTTARGQQATTQRRNLLLPFPQFTTITMQNQSLGTSWYNAFQFKLQQRFRHGLSYLVSYTNSKTMESVAYLSPQNSKLSRELVSFDVPQRLVVSGIYELPLGRRKSWLKSGWLSQIAGGWQVNWSGVFQSGVPMPYPDWYLRGDPKLESGQSLNQWFNTSKSVWVQRPTDTLRVTQLRSPSIRRHNAPQVNTTVLRYFTIHERQKLQLKASAFNVSNTPIFGQPDTNPASPSFGRVTIDQINLPRSIELGLRYSF